MAHLEQRLEQDLTRIRGRVAEQARLVEEAVKNAVHSIQTGDQNLAHRTILNDHPINRNMREIDRLCHSFIAVHLPSAGHLRLLSAVIRVNIELERIGDYAVVIAREGVQMKGPPEGAMARDLERLASETQLMLKQSVKAFNELNSENAKGTMLMANQMESSLDAIYDELMTNDRRERIKDIFAIFVIFTQLKRVADQAKNLCEDTVFAVTGDQKAPKVYNILFVDRQNNLLSQMAEVAARINFPESGRYRSAGLEAATAIDPRLTAFMEQRNLEFSPGEPTPLSSLTHGEITEQTAIISLEGDVGDYLTELPFHTSALNWEIPASDSGSDLDMEQLYREIVVRVTDLMQLLRGEEAS